MARVLIAGAGIGGLTAALALARIGVEVTLVERTPQLAEAGAGVQLSPNATRILARFGVLDALATHALRPRGIRVRSGHSGRQIVFMPLDEAEARWGAPYYVVHRADLQAVLHAAVAAEPNVSLMLGAEMAGFGTAATGIAASVRQSGIVRTWKSDALVGADGIRSIVRARLVDREDPPQQTGRTAWRALVDAALVDEPVKAAETALWLGAQAHLVHYPLDGGRRINVVAITEKVDAGPAADLWSAPGDIEVIGSRSARWHPRARQLIGAAQSWSTWPLFDRAPLASWNTGRVALVGDAAHPILPFLAQGSAQAIEDAAALAEAVASTRDLPVAFARYFASRHIRATRVQQTSRRLGQIYHLAGPSASARNIGMRLAGGRRLLHRYDWLYGLRPQDG